MSVTSTLTRPRSEPPSNTNTIARSNVAFRDDRSDERPLDVNGGYPTYPSNNGTLPIRQSAYPSQVSISCCIVFSSVSKAYGRTYTTALSRMEHHLEPCTLSNTAHLPVQCLSTKPVVLYFLYPQTLIHTNSLYHITTNK